MNKPSLALIALITSLLSTADEIDVVTIKTQQSDSYLKQASDAMGDEHDFRSTLSDLFGNVAVLPGEGRTIALHGSIKW